MATQRPSRSVEVLASLSIVYVVWHCWCSILVLLAITINALGGHHGQPREIRSILLYGLWMALPPWIGILVFRWRRRWLLAGRTSFVGYYRFALGSIGYTLIIILPNVIQLSREHFGLA
jgi:hypothetical protein